jgi:putrescine aminotransferase
MNCLKQLANQFPQIFKKITGRGLLIGMHFLDSEIGYKVSAGLFQRGVLVSGTLTNAETIRIEPPLVITQQQIDQVLDRLEDTLLEISRVQYKVLSF